jgi:hypothetical protein
MSLYDLTNLFLCFVHAADVGEPLRWHIANRF